MLPRSGDVLYVCREASPQFLARPIAFRVIRLQDWAATEGWVWVDGYELNGSRDAVERRTIFVQLAGLRMLATAPDPRTRNARPGSISTDRSRSFR